MEKIVIDTYLKEHIPYSIRIMLAHIEFRKKYYPNVVNDNQILDSVFVGSITKGRMLLEAMGVKLNVVANDIQDNPNKNTKGKDIRADDLNGKLEDIPNLRKNKPTDFKCLKHYLIAANKYELHLTAQDVPRDLDLYDKAIPIIIKMIDECFYSQSNQNIRAELISKNKLPSDYFS